MCVCIYRTRTRSQACKRARARGRLWKRASAQRGRPTRRMQAIFGKSIAGPDEQAKEDPCYSSCDVFCMERAAHGRVGAKNDELLMTRPGQ